MKLTPPSCALLSCQEQGGQGAAVARQPAAGVAAPPMSAPRVRVGGGGMKCPWLSSPVCLGVGVGVVLDVEGALMMGCFPRSCCCMCRYEYVVVRFNGH